MNAVLTESPWRSLVQSLPFIFGLRSFPDPATFYNHIQTSTTTKYDRSDMFKFPSKREGCVHDVSIIHLGDASHLLLLQLSTNHLHIVCKVISYHQHEGRYSQVTFHILPTFPRCWYRCTIWRFNSLIIFMIDPSLITKLMLSAKSMKITFESCAIIQDHFWYGTFTSEYSVWH